MAASNMLAGVAPIAGVAGGKGLGSHLAQMVSSGQWSLGDLFSFLQTQPTPNASTLGEFMGTPNPSAPEGYIMGESGPIGTMGPQMSTDPLMSGGGLAGSVAGSAGASQASGMLGLGSAASGVLPFLAAPAAAAMAYGTASSIPKIAKGDKLNALEQTALAPITFGGSFLYNPARSVFGSKKHKHQRQRDAIRGGMRESGFLDEDYKLTLPDGSVVDLGLDGGAKVNGMRPYDIDWTDQDVHGIAGDLNPLAAYFASMGGAPERQDQVVGQLVRAARQSGDPYENIKALYAKSGMDRNTIYEWVNSQDQIDNATKDAYRAAIDKAFGVINPNAEADAKKLRENPPKTHPGFTSGGQLKNAAPPSPRPKPKRPGG